MSNPHDAEILSHIFNPLLPTKGLVGEDDIIPEELHIEDAAEEMLPETTILAKNCELEGVREAEQGNHEAALEFFNQAVALAPNRASGYNNRAQAYRLMGNVEQAKLDLNNAINLSGGKGRVGCQAFCQRGLISLKEKREADAKVDFEMAAKLGSQFAKAQLVQLNPYAALCNKMLRDVIGKLQRGESEENENNCNKN